MDERPLDRHDAALVSADVVGYSRLISDDEIGTIRALSASRETIAKLVAESGGRLVDFVGDNFLAEFPAPLDAVQCAKQIHSASETLNRKVPSSRHLRFRIGIHMGTVTAQGDRLYGDGVNIAARLESLADPGGICLSDAVYRRVQNDPELRFTDMGTRQLKNIPRPVQAYQLVMPHASGAEVTDLRAGPAPPEALPLPAKPSLAVLPFVDLDMRQSQDHFCDGLTMDILTALVQIPSLFLISDMSSFSIKSMPMSTIEIGRQLGVQYVLDGGVRRIGNRLRVTARLCETRQGQQVWAQRFDRQLGDIFDIQDDITSEIVTAMDIKLVSGEPARVVRNAVKNLQALEYYYRGWSAMFSSAPDAIVLSQQMFEEMIRLEPDSFLGYAVGAWAYWWGIFKNASDDIDRDLDRVQTLVQKARELGDNTGMADLAMAHIHLMRKDHDKALAAAEQAVLTRPSCDISYAVKASILTYLGRPQEAVPLARLAIRLSPVYPSYYPTVLGYAHFHCNELDKAREAVEISIQSDPANLEALVLMAAINAAEEKSQQVHKIAERIQQAHPDFSQKNFADAHPYINEEDLKRILSCFTGTVIAKE